MSPSLPLSPSLSLPLFRSIFIFVSLFLPFLLSVTTPLILSIASLQLSQPHSHTTPSLPPRLFLFPPQLTQPPYNYPSPLPLKPPPLLIFTIAKDTMQALSSGSHHTPPLPYTPSRPCLHTTPCTFVFPSFTLSRPSLRPPSCSLRYHRGHISSPLATNTFNPPSILHHARSYPLLQHHPLILAAALHAGVPSPNHVPPHLVAALSPLTSPPSLSPI